MTSVDTPDWVLLGLGLLGGLALFLIGMSLLTDSLKVLAGHRMERLLGTLAGNRVTGALTGAVTTAVLQSSSVTSVLTVGFVAAELLLLTQAAAIIIGANLGTTVTAQIIALEISGLSLLLLAIGAVLWLFTSRGTLQQTGRGLAGLGTHGSHPILECYHRHRHHHGINGTHRSAHRHCHCSRGQYRHVCHRSARRDRKRS